MKRKSHTTKKKHPRREALVGLTPEDVIKSMTEDASHGRRVQKVRSEDKLEKGPVLQAVRTQDSETAGKGGLPGAVDHDDNQRPRSVVREKIPDDSKSSQISRVLKRLLGEAPPELVEYGVSGGSVPTNAEALAAVILKAALDGKQWAVELIRDGTEGKPIRAAQVNTSGAEVEEQLDRISTMRLNELAKVLTK